MYPEFDEVIRKHFELKEHALKMQLSKWRNYKAQESTFTGYPTYMYPHHVKSSGPTLEALYLSCVSAIDSWPRKQKARKNRNNTSTLLSRDYHNQTVQTIHAVEVNGVIEILDEQSVDSAIPLTPRASVDPPSDLANTTAEVIDLTE